MIPKSNPMDLTNADTVDDLTRRCRELRAENEFVKGQVLTLAAHAAVLRGAYRKNFGMLLATLGISDDSKTLPTDTGDKYENAFAINHDLILCVKRRMDTALAQPSPLAEAVRAVVEATIRAEKAHIEYMEVLGTSAELPNVQTEKVSKEMDVADKELEQAIAVYLSLRDGRDADRGEG